MKFFESKYTLCVTLSLVCFQMYLTKSSTVDYKSMTSRTVAQQGPQCIFSNPENVDELITQYRENGKNCFLHYDSSLSEFSLLSIEESDELDNTGENLLIFKTGVTTIPSDEYAALQGAEKSAFLRSTVADFFNNDGLAVIDDPRSDPPRPRIPVASAEIDPEPEVIAEAATEETEAPEPEAVVAAETPAVRPQARPAETFSRTDLRKIIEEYESTLEEITDATNDCKLADGDVDFSEAKDIYAELKDSDSFDNGNVRCSDRSCSNLDTAYDLPLIEELRTALEEFEDMDEFLLTDRKDIDSCKSDRLGDEDFLTAYQESGKCAAGSSDSLVLGERRRPRPRFQRPGAPATSSQDEDFSALQVCYYQNEILPGFRNALANGSQADFNEAIDGFTELASSLEGSNNNEAILTIGQANIVMAERVRTYEDALWDNIERIESSELSREQKDIQINDIKRRAAEGFAADRTRVASILSSGNATLAEQSLFMGSGGLYDFWGGELALVNNERQALPTGLSQNRLDILTFSGLDTATQSSIASQHDGTQTSVLDSNTRALESALGRSISRDESPVIAQSRENERIVPQAQRPSRNTTRGRFNDDTQNGRHLRAEGPGTGGPRPRGGLVRDSQRDLPSDHPAVSHLRDDVPRGGDRRTSRGRLDRSYEGATGIR